MNITNLGAALTVLARAEAYEHYAHADVDAWGAPSECHDLVSRGEAARQVDAEQAAERLAGASMADIVRQAKERGRMRPCSGDPKWQSFVGRVYSQLYPF